MGKFEPLRGENLPVRSMMANGKERVTMAYQVLHTAKCNKSACKGTEIHNERKITSKDEEVSEYQSHTNENIDPQRTPLNVALVGDMESNYYIMAKERITEIRGGISPTECVKDDEGKVTMPRLRKDAVWTCDTVISASPEFFKERFGWDKDNPDKADYKGMNEYFQHGVEFMQQKYGKDNVIGAIVHYDETTPHLHVHWTPITEQKLSYKALSSPNQLRALQTDFNEHIRGKGYDLERGEVDSKRKHLSQQTEKLNQAIKENNKKLAELERVKSDYEVAKEGSHPLPSLDPTKSKAKDIQAQNEALRLANRDLKNRLATMEQKLDRIEKANATHEKNMTDYYKPMERMCLDYSDRQAVYKDYIEKNPQALEQMRPFEREYAHVRKFGETMENHKQGYVECCDKLKDTEKAIADTRADIGTEKAIINHIDDSNRHLDSLRTSLDERREQLDQLQGKFFKGKDKKALQGEIDSLQEKIGTIEQDLRSKYGLKECYPNDLQRERYRHQDKLVSLGDKVTELEKNRTNVTVAKNEHLSEYKYMAVRQKSFRKEWQETIKRYDNHYEPPMEHKRAFSIDRLTANERTEIKDRLKKEGLGENTKAFSFVKEQDPKLKSFTQSQDQSHTQSRSRGWSHER